MKGLAVGRIVHFTYPDLVGNVKPNEHPLIDHAALIVRVVDAERGVVNLVWWDGNGDATKQRNVPYSETAKESCWHWPVQA